MAVKYVAAEWLQRLTNVGQACLDQDGEQIILRVAPARTATVGNGLKSEPELQLNHLSSVTAVDYPEYIELVYHLYSHSLKHELVMKARLPKSGEDLPAAASVTSVWPAANFQEREIYDLMGVRFTGHPALRRILLPEQFAGHPLRKDFQLQPRSQRGESAC